MTPSLKKLKASRRTTLWYNEKTDELFIVVNSKHWQKHESDGQWYSCFTLRHNLKQFAHNHWEFIAWL